MAYNPSKHWPCGYWYKNPVETPDYFSNPPSQGRWIYPLTQYNTPYMYCFEINPFNTLLNNYEYGANAIIKIDLSQSPPVALERLRLRANYTASFTPNKLTSATQSGPFCISNNGTRLFYILRHYTRHWYDEYTDLPDAELVEVDITGTYMRTVQITTFSGTSLFTASGEKAIDACANSTHSFWLTNGGRIIKIAHGSHSIVDVVSVGTDVKALALHKREDNLIYGKSDNGTSPSTYHIMDTNFSDIATFLYKSCMFVRTIDDLILTVGYVFSLFNRHPINSFDLTPTYCGNTLIDISNVIFQQYFYPRHVGNNIFFLNRQSNFSGTNMLYCISAPNNMINYPTPTTDLTILNSKSLTYYAGDTYGVDYDWAETSESGIAWTVPVLAHVRYKSTNIYSGSEGYKMNWLACFDVGEVDMDLLTDTAIAYPAYSHY